MINAAIWYSLEYKFSSVQTTKITYHIIPREKMTTPQNGLLLYKKVRGQQRKNRKSDKVSVTTSINTTIGKTSLNIIYKPGLERNDKIKAYKNMFA